MSPPPCSPVSSASPLSHTLSITVVLIPATVPPLSALPNPPPLPEPHNARHGNSGINRGPSTPLDLGRGVPSPPLPPLQGCWEPQTRPELTRGVGAQVPGVLPGVFPGAQVPGAFPLHPRRLPRPRGRRGRRSPAGHRQVRAVPGEELPPVLCPAQHLQNRSPGTLPGSEGNQENQVQDVPAAAEHAAAPVPRHGAAAPVPQGCAQGHSHRDHRHPALRQLPGHCLDVFLPTAAPDPPVLDTQAAGGVPGCLRLHPEGLLPRRGAEPGAGSAFPARAPAPGAPAAALCPGAGRCPAPPGPALGREELVLWVSAGAEQAPGGSCALSQVLFLTPHLPAFFLRYRLRSHVLEIRHLDRALLRLGLGQLSEEELRAACYLRGLNSTHLGRAECRAWLEQWLRLSCELQASEASLLAHSMVLLSLNYSRPPE